jgi:hypothetical protein
VTYKATARAKTNEQAEARRLLRGGIIGRESDFEGNLKCEIVLLGS